MSVEPEEFQPVRPVSVLLIIDNDVLHRMGNVVRQLCVGMIDEAVKVTVLSASPRSRFDTLGPFRILTPSRRLMPWRRPDADEILELTGGDKPQVIHALSPRLAQWARGWAGPWRAVMVVHLSDMEDVHDYVHLQRTERSLGVAATRSLEAIVTRMAPRFAEDVRAVPWGITARSEPACLARPERVPSAMVTAPLTRDCGLDAVLRALAELIRRGQEMLLFVVSSGPAERSFRQLAEKLKVRHYVTFADPMSDWSSLSDAMHGADFYILPGIRRRFTASTLTAMSNGLALIGPAGTFEDYLIDGQTAALFDPHRPATLEKQWLSLLDDRNLARRLAHGGLDYVRAHHKASSMVTSMAWFYREMDQRGDLKVLNTTGQ